MGSAIHFPKEQPRHPPRTRTNSDTSNLPSPSPVPVTGTMLPPRSMCWLSLVKTPYVLTTFSRSLLLLVFCLFFNILCWIASGILFGRRKPTRSILSLCLLAWTTGLRHGTLCLFLGKVSSLDADHISAIDNATRALINLNQLPVTCGLFFSLGHSTIVIAVNVAITISADVYDKIHGVGDVGGIVGAAVSGTFLFVIGLANSIILWRLLGRRRRAKLKQLKVAQGIVANVENDREQHIHETSGLIMRFFGPVTKFVNRPWKMYPVGVLFGFGFDTASSIALIAITALAKKSADGASIPRGSIMVLSFLFTAGMSLVDSIDSVLMLYSYAGFPEEEKWALIKHRSSFMDFTSAGEEQRSQRHDPKMIQFERRIADADVAAERSAVEASPQVNKSPSERAGQSRIEISARAEPPVDPDGAGLNSIEMNPTVFEGSKSQGFGQNNRIKLNIMSNLSLVLTFISILVALSISLITIMGLIGDNCGACQRAVNSDDGGGLAGRWWRGWAKANENSGFIGAGIVGVFVVVGAGWYASLWIVRKWKG